MCGQVGNIGMGDGKVQTVRCKMGSEMYTMGNRDNIFLITRDFLVVQWLRIRLPMQGTWVRSLVRELRCHMPGDN